MQIKVKVFLVMLLVFIGAGLIPALLIAHSNKTVFPTTLYMANGMLVIAIIADVVCMISASSKKADGWVMWAGCLFLLALGGVLWWNLGGHWQLSREIDGATASVREADLEREKLERLADKAKEREKELSETRRKEMEAQALLEKNQAINRDAAVRQFRATGVRVAAPKPIATTTPQNETPAKTEEQITSPLSVKSKITPEEVRASWNETLTMRAYIEAGVGIFSLIILMALWHGDLNGNGVTDRIERLFVVDPDFVRSSYPSEYAKLSGTTEKPRIAPGMAPARAESSSTHAPGK